MLAVAVTPRQAVVSQPDHTDSDLLAVHRLLRLSECNPTHAWRGPRHTYGPTALYSHQPYWRDDAPGPRRHTGPGAAASRHLTLGGLTTCGARGAVCTRRCCTRGATVATVHCHLCAHRCHIRPGHRGICAVRENQDGTLYTLIYGQVISQAVDPIEKKPLYHFLPGSTSYSIATPRLQLPLPVLPELAESRSCRAGRGRASTCQRAAREIVAAAKRYRLRKHLLHLHRADHLLRVRLRHGAAWRGTTGWRTSSSPTAT